MEPLSIRRRCGFTLIEVIVVTAVIAILAAVAIPAYTDYVRRGNRATAQAFLSDLATRQQQFLLNRRSYGSLADLGVAVPADVGRHYTVTVATALPANAPPTFMLTAAPQGGQVADRCGTLTLDQNGARTPATGCW